MKQTVALPNQDDLTRIESQRDWVRNHLTSEPQATYEALNEKLRLLQGILDAGWIEPHETLKLQCLGVTLGDSLVQKFGMEWIIVEDESGRDPAVRVPGTTIILFPLTMISKRVERGETVNVCELFDGVAKHVSDAEAVADRLK
ncbi:MAG TPA: DUF3806 domain-containing protein [Aestuariivirga sp.]|nr:DUF3806 domain-containing protein [Aestuariivirga sp.]